VDQKVEVREAAGVNRKEGDKLPILATRIKYVDKKSAVMRPNLQPKICKSPVVA
jgi:hypothetical protein